MSDDLQRVRVVLVSPSDVEEERAGAQAVVDELNRTIAAARGVVLVLWRWETDAHPGLHLQGPQGLIDELIEIEHADVVVGVFWKRFGTATAQGPCGTEHELRRAWAAWRKNQRPQVMVYFCSRPYEATTSDETAQWGRVLDFKGELPNEQLWWPFGKSEAFSNLLREHLTRYLLTRGPGRTASTTAAAQRRLRFNLPTVAASFTGRDEELAHLDQVLNVADGAITTQVIAGLGGAGKSQLAARHTQRCQDRYAIVAWIRAQDGGIADLAALATKLGQTVQSASPGELAQLALDWLSSCDEPWLLILDNVESAAQLDALLPRGGNGCVLATTRDRALSQFGAVLDLDVFDDDTATGYLMQRAGRPDDAEAARKVARSLGCLPLALSHAAAYCQSGTSFSEYLGMLEQLPASEMFDRHPEHGYAQTVASTWKTSIAAAAVDAPQAGSLLELAACFGADAIPRALFAVLVEDLDVAPGRKVLADAFLSLTRYSLAAVDDTSVSVHRLLQRVIRDELNARGDTGRAASALDALIRTVPANPPPERWIECHNLAPHALAVAATFSASHPRRIEVVRQLNAISSALNRAERGGALTFTEAALLHAERLAEPFTPERLEARSNVATARYWLGELDFAIALEQQIVADCKSHLGDDRVEYVLQTIEAAANLADSYRTRGDYDLAIPVQKRVLAERERLLPNEPPHSKILMARDRLAVSYRDAGQVDAAIELLQSVIADSARTLGDTDSDTVLSRANLASCYMAKRDYVEAIAQCRIVLEQRESRLPRNHPHVLDARDDLADALRANWIVDEAREVLRRLAAERHELLGPRHPATVSTERRLREVNAGLLVRPAGQDDVDTLAAIKYAREDELYRGYGSHEEHDVSLREFCGPEFIRHLLADTKTTLLAAQDRTRVVGLGAITRHEDHTWLHALYASSSGRGIGSAILEALVEISDSGHRAPLRCGVFEPNTPAREFFAQRGFVADGSRPSESYAQVVLIEYGYAHNAWSGLRVI